MKERLGAILVRAGLIKPEERDQGLEAQILSGGRLGTNLVDMNLLTVDQVGQYLSTQHRLPLASFDDLYRAPDDVVKRVPKTHCARYKVFPLRIEDKLLHLAMLDPDDLVAIDELNFLLALQIQPYVVPQLRLLQVLEKRHGFMRERRFLRIPDETESAPRRFLHARTITGPFSPTGRISALMPALTEVPPPVEAARPTEPARPSEPARPTKPEAAVARGGAAKPFEGQADENLVFLDARATRHETARPPRSAERSTSDEVDDGIEVVVEEPDDMTEVVDVPPEVPTAVVPAPQATLAEHATHGPGDDEVDTAVFTPPFTPPKGNEDETRVVHDTLTIGGLRSAATAMEHAEDRDAIIDLLVHPFRYQPVLGVLFLVRGEMAVGLSVSTAHKREEVRGLALPLATASLLHEAFYRKQVVLGTAAEDPLQQVIARYLRWDEPEEVCVAPVSHGDRVINLLCVQTRTGTRFPAEMKHEMEALCDRAAQSYVALIHRNKRPVTRPHDAAPSPAEVDNSARPVLPDRRFFVTGHVGQEGIAAVWRAIDTRSQRVVTIMVMPASLLRDDQLQQLSVVVDTLNRLNHPHVLQPLATGTCEDGRAYLATEFAGASSLRQRLTGKPPPPHPEVAEIVRQLGDALVAAHAGGVVHGDLRPENVLFPLPDKLQIKLAGFGMPRGLPAGLPRPHTAHYLAPEGLGVPGNESVDVYALAALTFEMLGGKLPLTGESMLNPPELPPLLPGVPHPALNLLARALAQQPEQRPGMRELAQDLFRVLRSSVG